MPKARVQIIDATADNLTQLPCCGNKNVGHEGHVAETA